MIPKCRNRIKLERTMNYKSKKQLRIQKKIYCRLTKTPRTSVCSSFFNSIAFAITLGSDSKTSVLDIYSRILYSNLLSQSVGLIEMKCDFTGFKFRIPNSDIM
jgi:hypothetical protein